VRKTTILILAAAALLAAPDLAAQSATTHRTVFPRGLRLSTGIGGFAVRDEYLSRDEYSGSLPSLRATWSRFHERSGYRLGFDLRSSSDISSGDVSAQITEFALDLDYLYPAGRLSLGSRDAFLFVGPFSEFFLYFNKQDIASEGLNLAISFAGLVSAGVTSELVVPLSSRLDVSASARLALLSACLRIVDLMEDDESPFKFLTPLSGTRASAALRIRYRLLDRLSLDLGYEAQLLRITPWDRLKSASDNVVVAVAVGL